MKIKLYQKKVFGLGISILMISLVAYLYSASTETIQGEVTAIKPDASSFSLKRLNPSVPFLNREISISLKESTRFEGLSSVKELAVGDEVIVDVNKNQGAGTWEANSIKISKLKIHEPILNVQENTKAKP